MLALLLKDIQSLLDSQLTKDHLTSLFKGDEIGQSVLECFSRVDLLEVVSWMECTFEFLQQFLPRNEST